MNTLKTRPKMEQFATPEIFAAVRAVAMSMAYHQVITERVRPVQQAAVAAAGLKEDLAEGAPVTTMRDAYLSTDEAACAAMYADYGRRLIEGGCFGLTRAEIEDGKCPELMAETMKIKAENLLLEIVCPLFEIKPQNLIFTKRKEFLDLTMKFVIGLPGFDKNGLKL